MEENSKRKFDIGLFARIVGLSRPYKFLFFSTILLAVFLAPVSMLRPFLVAHMVDDYILPNDLSGLYRMAVVFLVVIILTVVMRYYLLYYSSLLGQNIIHDLRNRVFGHILSLRMRFFDTTPIGRVTTRTINDIQTINTVFTEGIITMVADLLSIFAVLGIMLYTSWQLTLLVLLTLPLLFIATYVFKEKVKTAFQKVRTQLAEMNAFLQERIVGMSIIQIFTAEKQEMDKFKKINRKYTQANLDAITHYAVFYPVVEFINYLSLAILVYLGARYVIQDTVTLGALLAFPWYIDLLFRPIRMMADKFNTLQMGMVAADRVFEVIDNRDQIQDSGYLTPQVLKGDVEFRKVNFAYDGQNNVLHDVDFKLDAGKTLAIVGSTGSGKTTIINLITRFYDIDEGEILIDGKNIKEYKVESLRSKMAVVLQDVFLFYGTIFENITLKDPDITFEEVLEASKVIGAHEYIMDLNEGYEYMVMERGANLSMGQRQLISFVRALVFDPNILILDEATSSIDTETEEVIQHAIEKLIAKRSSIIIAHRLTTIRNADYIMVMSKGKIIEFGNHDSLLVNENGRYKELYEMQFGNESELLSVDR